MAKWLEEFGAEFAVPDEIQSLVNLGKLHDLSWHNNACPSFADRNADRESDIVGSRCLWVDHPEAAQREINHPRFAVTTMAAGWQIETTLYEGDDLAVALKAMNIEAGQQKEV